MANATVTDKYKQFKQVYDCLSDLLSELSEFNENSVKTLLKYKTTLTKIALLYDSIASYFQVLYN